ncbi:hypothetical protein D3C77_799430 [compost metagenome]
MLTDIHLAFNPGHPAKYRIGRLVDAVEQAQDRQGHGKNDTGQHTEPQHPNGCQYTQPELETAEFVDFS